MTYPDPVVTANGVSKAKEHTSQYMSDISHKNIFFPSSENLFESVLQKLTEVPKDGILVIEKGKLYILMDIQ